MQLLTDHQREEASPCGYLPGQVRQCVYFLAEDLAGAELDQLLRGGWRKFGPYFFRPDCPGCRACTPLRVNVSAFSPSRSQRRVLKRNRALTVRYAPLRFSARVYEIYRAHATARFGGAEQGLEDFLFSFYCPSAPACQTEIYADGTLIAVGWLDVGETSLSSVYFCFDPAYARFSPGTFGALCEIEYARRQGRSWYYLGYYVPGNGATSYKDHFRPRQHYDWQSASWVAVKTPPNSV